MAIQSFKGEDTETTYQTGKSRRFGHIANVALSKLDMLIAAVALKDLASPAGNQLEAFPDDRGGERSIRKKASGGFTISGPPPVRRTLRS